MKKMLKLSIFQLSIYINDQKVSEQRIRFSLATVFQDNKRKSPVVSIGGPLLRGNTTSFDSLQSIQCTIRNFVIFNGLLTSEELNKLIQKYITQGNDLLDVIKSHLDDQIQLYNQAKDDSPLQRNRFTELQYLNIKSFTRRNHKLITDTLFIKDGMIITKIVENQNQKNIFKRLFQPNKHSFQISQQRNKIIKVYYQNIHKIDQLSFAEMFMSLDNMDLIYFIISLTTGSPVFSHNSDQQAFNNNKDSLIPVEGIDPVNESTIYKIKKYSDSKLRQLFMEKAEGKRADQYVNLSQFQEQFSKKIRLSNDSQTLTPNTVIKENFALQIIQIENDIIEDSMEDINTDLIIGHKHEMKLSIELFNNSKTDDQTTTNLQLSSQKEATSQDSKELTTPPSQYIMHNGLPNFNSFQQIEKFESLEPMTPDTTYMPTQLYKFNSTNFYPVVQEDRTPKIERSKKIVQKSQERNVFVRTTNRLLSLKLNQPEKKDSMIEPSIKKQKTSGKKHKLEDIYSSKTIENEVFDKKKYSSEEFLKRYKKTRTSIKIEESQVDFISEYVTLKGCYYGKLTVQNLCISFESDYEKRPSTPDHLFGTQDENLKDGIQKLKKINIASIEEVQTRRFNLKEIAVEIFVKDRKSYFFNLYSTKFQQNFIRVLESYDQNIKFVIDRRQAFITSDYQRQWQKGAISNFEYLMLINKYSGRTFNDINQYPVFPWILKDFNSYHINLDDISIYRDLSLPIGALNKDRLEDYKQRACTLEESDIDYFLYGSHYQTPAYIIHFLMRIEPFMSLAQDLQSGKFDNADRMFYSISATWDSCMENSTDVKELTPEFYCCPEFLMNVSHIDFGKRSNGCRVEDVILPNWAKTPQEFIETQRLALESNYVSQNIHLWINLVFGAWQFGDEAKKRDNLFYSTTYEQNLVKLDAMNYSDKKCYMQQIQSFGQTPYQLFMRQHEQRDLKIAISPCLYFIGKEFGRVRHYEFEMNKLFKFDRPVILIKKIGIFIYLVTTSKQVFKIKLSTLLEPKRDKHFEKTINSQFFYLEANEKLKLNTSKIFPETPSNRNSPIHPTTNKKQVALSSQQTQIVTYNAYLQFHIEEDYIWIGGYESGAVLRSKLDKITQISVQHHIRLHKKRISCIHYSKVLNVLCLGGKDNRVTIWNFSLSQPSAKLSFKTPSYIIYDHEDSIKDLQIVDDSFMVVSVDKKGKVLFHSVHSGEYLKELQLDLEKEKNEKVRIMQIDDDGYMAFLTNESNLVITTFNGFQQRKLRLKGNIMITHMISYKKKHLLLSTTNGELFLVEDYVKLLDTDRKISNQLSLIHRNTNQISIYYFTYYIEHDNLFILISYVEGSLIQLVLKSEQEKQIKKGLKQVGFIM